VTFSLSGPLGETLACHCTQCRRQSGHYFAAVGAPRAAVVIVETDDLVWYRSSEIARRGFCRRCGSNLFWDPFEGEVTQVSLGALDAPTGLKLERHVHVASMGDYYQIADGLPQDET
jgi:hypothetical protein